MNKERWLLRLCAAIQMPPAVTEAILTHEQTMSLPRFSPTALPRDWEQNLTAMKEAIGPDVDGLKLLTAQLLSAEETWNMYQQMDIPWEIFTDTMACFSRFVGEHWASFGHWGFDRSWWVPRQLTGRLFRIGVLEYELLERDEDPVISLHIPSGAKLEQAALRRSYCSARSLIGRCFPRWQDAPMECRSWLLSPALKSLLPPTSRILYFQENFSITPLPQSGLGCLLWVFRRTDLPLEQLPEETSLQRRLKAHLLSGGDFPDGKGRLLENPFLPNDAVKGAEAR